jgi:ATP-dependent protease ClpP protease subunit
MKILKIENKAAKVKLDDTVDEYSRKILQDEIAKTYGSANAGNVAAFGEITNCAQNAVDTLEIEINSPGGSVFDGYLIYNELLALRARGVYVTATINVLAASMGSVIAMAADTVRIVKNGTMMIHDASIYAGGKAKDLARMAKVLDGLSNEIAAIYAAKTGKTTEEMRALMLDETWLTASESVAIGLADSIFDIRTAQDTMSAVIETEPPNSMKYLDRLTNPAAPEALERITALEASITSLETDHAATLAERDTVIAAHAATIATAETALAEVPAIRSEVATLTATNATLTATIATNAATISAHAAELEAARANASAEAVAIAAAVGITKPLAVEGGSDDAKKTVTRAQLNNMKPFEVSAFFKSGGKLSD